MRVVSLKNARYNNHIRKECMMKNNIDTNFERALVTLLVSRLNEPRKFIQIVTGPRQTGKTTAIRQALRKTSLPHRYASADMAQAQSQEWLKTEWRQARDLISETSPTALLVVDEIQNVDQWSSVVKLLWDEDAWSGIDLRVVLSGSSSLLLQKGLSESLMGRFELLPSTHWTYSEMRTAFGFSIKDFFLFGGYPAGAALRGDADRWNRYINDAVVEATLSKDVFQMENIRKPALMRKLFLLGCKYSAQEISYRKLLGQLDDKGNTSTIAHYLDLLASAGLLCGIQKYDANELNVRKSSPRLMVFDTSLISATAHQAEDLLNNPELKGHLVESAVGTYLLAKSKTEMFDVFWWRDDNREVDFVIRKGDNITALEVKSGRIKDTKGLYIFRQRYPEARPLVVGDRNVSIEDFLSGNVPLFIG